MIIGSGPSLSQCIILLYYYDFTLRWDFKNLVSIFDHPKNIRRLLA